MIQFDLFWAVKGWWKRDELGKYEARNLASIELGIFQLEKPSQVSADRFLTASQNTDRIDEKQVCARRY